VELNLLRCLCLAGGIATVPSNWQRSLGDYLWADQDHRIVFEALVRSAKVPASSLRERLAAEATRMGFPDIHWDAYFEARPSGSESNRTVAELIGELIPQSARSQ
jgi:hypothetical protein